MQLSMWPAICTSSIIIIMVDSINSRVLHTSVFDVLFSQCSCIIKGSKEAIDDQSQFGKIFSQKVVLNTTRRLFCLCYMVSSGPLLKAVFVLFRPNMPTIGRSTCVTELFPLWNGWGVRVIIWERSFDWLPVNGCKNLIESPDCLMWLIRVLHIYIYQ